MKSSIRRLLYTAQGYFSQGEPFPLDLTFALGQEGIEPEYLQDRFESGFTVSEIIIEKGE